MTSKVPAEGRTFLVSWADKTVRLWNRKTGELIKDFYASHHNSRPGIFALAVSPDGLALISAGWAGMFQDYSIATGAPDGMIGFWNLSSGKLLYTFQTHEQSIPALVYSSDGHHLVSGSLDKIIKVWEIVKSDC